MSPVFDANAIRAGSEIFPRDAISRDMIFVALMLSVCDRDKSAAPRNGKFD